jgi:hypothetical protein
LQVFDFSRFFISTKHKVVKSKRKGVCVLTPCWYKKGPIGSGGNHFLSGHGTNTQAQKKYSTPFVFGYGFIFIDLLLSIDKTKKKFLDEEGQ